MCITTTYAHPGPPADTSPCQPLDRQVQRHTIYLDTSTLRRMLGQGWLEVLLDFAGAALAVLSWPSGAPREVK